MSPNSSQEPFGRASSGPQDRPSSDPIRPIGSPDPFGPQDDVRSQPTRRSGGGFGTFPFPHYTTRTRSGAQVSVGGCCLPLPLGCLTGLTVAAGAALASWARRH